MAPKWQAEVRASDLDWSLRASIDHLATVDNTRYAEQPISVENLLGQMGAVPGVSQSVSEAAVYFDVLTGRLPKENAVEAHRPAIDPDRGEYINRDERRHGPPGALPLRT